MFGKNEVGDYSLYLLTKVYTPLIIFHFKQLSKHFPTDLGNCSDSDVDYRGHSHAAHETGYIRRKTNPAQDVDQGMDLILEEEHQCWRVGVFAFWYRGSEAMIIEKL